jgi:hypothetical protein
MHSGWLSQRSNKAGCPSGATTTSLHARSSPRTPRTRSAAKRSAPPAAYTARRVAAKSLVEQDIAPIINCQLSSAHGADAGAGELLCNSRLWISQDGRTLNTHERLPMVRVTISSNSMQLSQQTYSPSYTHTEPNGLGCGECNFATLQVALPAQP